MTIIDIHENHPSNKSIYSFGSKASAVFALKDGVTDNALFRIDGAGRLFLKNALNGLDYENPTDHDHNNQYDVVATRTVDGVTQDISLSVRVQDIFLERSVRAPGVKPTVDMPKSDFASSQLPDASTQNLLTNRVWSMPLEGPLIITWSMATPESFSRGDLLYTDTQTNIDKLRHSLNKAFAAFETVANLKFIEVSDNVTNVGDLRIYAMSAPDSNYGGQANFPDPNRISSIEFYHVERFGGDLPAQLPLHEIGHALGLSHAFETWGRWPGNLPRSSPDSVMAYNYSVKTLQSLDIKALRFLYGEKGTNFEGVETHLKGMFRVRTETIFWREHPPTM